MSELVKCRREREREREREAREWEKIRRQIKEETMIGRKGRTFRDVCMCVCIYVCMYMCVYGYWREFGR
jgi:hypothetical protein